LSTGKSYVGQTKQDPKKRFGKHKSDAKLGKSTTYISRAIQLYGIDFFSFEVLACCKTQEDANYLEAYLIKLKNTLVPFGYNISTGGHCGFSLTEEQKLIRSKNSKKYSKKIPITLINIKTHVAMSFESKYEAARFLKCNPARIYETLKRKSCIYKDYYILLARDYSTFKYPPKVKNHAKYVLAFNEKGNEYAFARVFDTQKIGASRSVVARCLKNPLLKSNGYYFKTISQEEYIKHNNKFLPQ
jgi:hypothetical protein